MPGFARIIRGNVLTMKDADYVLAARGLGAGDLSILVTHILPNVIAPIVVLASLTVSSAVLTAASLSFLGLGSQPPTPEWGAMLSDGRPFMQSAWWLALFPGIMLTLTVLASNIVGDGLRDALDPRKVMKRLVSKQTMVICWRKSGPMWKTSLEARKVSPASAPMARLPPARVTAKAMAPAATNEAVNPTSRPVHSCGPKTHTSGTVSR